MVLSSYTRKPSAEEAREGYLLILKDRLGFFPPVATPWELTDGNEPRRVMVEAHPCECRGPEFPHEHYRLRLPGIEKGHIMIIHRDEEAYRLER